MFKTLCTSGLVLVAAVLVSNCGKKEEAKATQSLDGYWNNTKLTEKGKTRDADPKSPMLLHAENSKVRYFSKDSAFQWSQPMDYRIEKNKLITKEGAKENASEYTFDGTNLVVKENADNSLTLNRITKAKADEIVTQTQAANRIVAPPMDSLPKADPKVLPKVDPKVLPKVDPKVLPKVDPKVLPKVDPKVLPKVDPKVAPKA